MTPMSQLSKSGGFSMNNQYNIVIVETLNDYYVISTAMLIRMAPIIMYVGKIHYYFMATAAVCFPILNCTLCSHQAFPMPVYFCSRIHESMPCWYLYGRVHHIIVKGFTRSQHFLFSY